jgi:hypothetical protein
LSGGIDNLVNLPPYEAELFEKGSSGAFAIAHRKGKKVPRVEVLLGAGIISSEYCRVGFINNKNSTGSDSALVEAVQMFWGAVYGSNNPF